MNEWEVIGITPTLDEQEIKEAYLKQLTIHNPEDDPEGFMQLREAYEKILVDIKDKNLDTEMDPELVKWLQKLAAIYNDFSKRIDEKEWKTLLQDPVCTNIEKVTNTSTYLLYFIMGHTVIPHHILAVLDKTFHWQEKEQLLKEQFPEEFVDFIIANIKYEDHIRYELFLPKYRNDSQKIDTFIITFSNTLGYFKAENKEKSEEGIRQLEKLGIQHLDFSILKVKYALFLLKDRDLACHLAEELLLPEIKDIKALYWYVRPHIGQGHEEKLKDYVKLLIEKDGRNPEILEMAAQLTFELKDYEKALKYYEEAAKQENWQELIDGMHKCHEFLAQKYEAMEEKTEQDWWELFKHSYYLGNFERMMACEKALSDERKNTFDYLNMMAEGYHELGNYREALNYRKELIAYGEEGEMLQVFYRNLGMEYECLDDYQKALEVYDEVLKKYPRSGRFFYLKSNVYYHLGQLNEAITYCDKAIEAEKERQQVIYPLTLKAKILYDLGQFEKVIICCQQVQQTLVTEDSMILQARALYQLDAYEAIVELVEKVLQTTNIHPVLLACYGCSLRELGRYKEAEEVLLHTLEIVHNTEIIYEELAALYEMTKQYKKALLYIDKAIKKQPELDRLFYARLDILKAMEDYTTALKEINRRIKEGKSSKAEYIYAGSIYIRQKQIPQAIAAFQKVLEEENNNLKACIALGDLYQKEGDYIKAATYYKTALTNDYALPTHYFRLIFLYRRLEKYKDAINLAVRALKAYPDEDGMYHIIAKIYMKQKQYINAITYFEKYVQLTSEKAYAYGEIAYCYARLKKRDKAIAMYEKAIAVQPDVSDGYVAYGKFYFIVEKDYKKAAPYWEKAFELDSEDAYIALYTGEVYKHLGALKKAKRYFNISLQIALIDLENNPEDACSYEAAADAYCQLEAYDKARKMAEKAISCCPKMFNCPYHYCVEGYKDLATTLEAEKEYKEALYYYEKAQEVLEQEEYEEGINRLKRKEMLL